MINYFYIPKHKGAIKSRLLDMQQLFNEDVEYGLYLKNAKMWHTLQIINARVANRNKSRSMGDAILTDVVSEYLNNLQRSSRDILLPPERLIDNLKTFFKKIIKQLG